MIFKYRKIENLACGSYQRYSIEIQNSPVELLELINRLKDKKSDHKEDVEAKISSIVRQMSTSRECPMYQ